MEAINQLLQKTQSYILDLLNRLRLKVFGANNERLDFVLDSFNKLQPNQQRGALAGLSALFFVFILLGIWLYNYQVGELHKELSESYAGLRQFRSLGDEYRQEAEAFGGLVDSVKRKVDPASSKAMLDQMAKKMGINIGQLDERDVTASEETALSKELREVSVDVSMDNISLAKLIKFLTEVEKSGKFVRVGDLRIRSRYGTKLYFDARVVFRAFKPA